MKKIIRVTTVPIALKILLKGQLNFMRQYYKIIGVASPGKEAVDVVNDEGVEVIEIQMTRSITPLKDLNSLLKLYKLFRKEKPHIVHSHTPKAGTLAMLAAKLANVPHRLHTIAGLPLLEVKGIKRILLDTVEKITYASATMIYPNSFGLKNIILKNGYTTSKKLKVIANGSSNGIDINHFSRDQITENLIFKLRNDLTINNQDIVFIFVGRLVADKGINELIHAFRRLSKTYENVKLLLVGVFENELDPLKEETLKEINSNKNIISVGWQNDVRPYFAISYALVFPSYREGFPNVVMQAGAMEIPSIVTDINGCNEIIKHNTNGLIVPPKNQDALYDAMQELVTNSEKQESLASSSRDMISKNYKREVVWNALKEEYDNLD